MTVLYADDDPEDQELFSDALKETFPSTALLLASHGKEVLTVLSNTKVLPDYIFLDINMPVMGGKDCLQHLKRQKELQHIPVIIYTTTSSRRELQIYIELGADDFIVKSDSFEGIKDNLRKVLSRTGQES